jgi:hypothetical protein
MSTVRQTNGANGCLMSPQKVRYHLKVEQLFARRPRRGLVLTYKHQALRLAGARFTRAWGPLVVGRGCIWCESSSKQLILCQKKCYPPPPSRNIDEVESNMQQTWQLSADIQRYITMRQCCVAVIRARGGHMRYLSYSVIFHLRGMSNQLDISNISM